LYATRAGAASGQPTRLDSVQVEQSNECKDSWRKAHQSINDDGSPTSSAGPDLVDPLDFGPFHTVTFDISEVSHE
jgi:hypothetical protein